MTTIQQMFFASSVQLPSFITFGNKLPVYGSSGGTYPPPGWTGLLDNSVDDGWIQISLPFTFFMTGSAYTDTYISSNTYLTFGSGSALFSLLSASNPNLPKFMFGAADNSYQRVSRFASGTNYQRIRYEGTAGLSGTVGSPNIVLEITLFNPANYGGFNVLELLTGNHARTNGVTLVASASSEYLTYNQNSLTSYVFLGNSNGTNWSVYPNCYVNNTNY